MPDATSGLNKKEQVAQMFNNIAENYDFLNHFLSLGIDKGWRKKAIKEASSVNPTKILDVATGTGDLAIAASELRPEKIEGIDIADQMLEIGRKKIAERDLAKMIELQTADSISIPFSNNTFDVVMCAYGVRNFEFLEDGLKEMSRVMRSGGKLVILEFSKPTTFPVKQMFGLYFKFVLPLLGKVFSKHNRAYAYLPESVKAFPQGAEFCGILERCGFVKAHARPLTFGITSLYTAYKP